MSEEAGKILHIISGDLWGGAEVQVLHQLSALQARNWSVEVLFFNNLETCKRFERAGIPYVVCDERQSFFSFLKNVRETISSIKPQLIVAHGYKANFVAAISRSRTPWIATYHGHTESLKGVAALKMKIYNTVERLLSRYSATKVVCVSHSLANVLSFSKLPHLEVVHNVTEFKESSDKTVDLKTPAILMVGRLVPVKRVDRGLRVFDELSRYRKENGEKDAHLYVVGDGPLLEELKSDAKKLTSAPNIHFLGFRVDSEQLIGSANILLISSDSEGIPTVLLEAIAQGTAVVSTNVGGIAEALEKVPGYPAALVEVEDEAMLATALQRLIDLELSSEQRNQLSSTAKKSFSPEVAAIQLEKIYRSIIAA